MIRHITHRLLETIPLLWLLATLAFLMVRLAPGNAFSAEKELSPETRAAIEAQYGYDSPLWQQYLRYMGLMRTPEGGFDGLLQGNLGMSRQYQGWSVAELLKEKIPVSLELGAYALLLATACGIALGTIAAVYRNSAADRSAMLLATLGICLPSFILGPLLVLVFAVWLQWFSVSGWFLPADRVLPSVTLAFFYTAYLARLTRTSHLEVCSADYIRTARAKGLSPAAIHLRHGLRNSLLPVVSYLAPAAAGLISGSFVVETIFRIPGLGRFFVEAAINRDETMIVGCALFYAVLLILLNLFAEILQTLLNPRMKFS